MSQELRFREYYRHLPDDELARIALRTNELVSEAQQALKGELQKRGLTDISVLNQDHNEAKPALEGTKLLFAKLSQPLAAILLIGWIVATANYYMELGWFGRYGRLVLSIVVLSIVFFIIFARRMLRK